MKRLSDTLTYRGIASEAVFTEPPVVGEFGPPYYPYWRGPLTGEGSGDGAVTPSQKI